jgi:hypothetical protein
LIGGSNCDAACEDATLAAALTDPGSGIAAAGVGMLDTTISPNDTSGGTASNDNTSFWGDYWRTSGWNSDTGFVDVLPEVSGYVQGERTASYLQGDPLYMNDSVNPWGIANSGWHNGHDIGGAIYGDLAILGHFINMILWDSHATDMNVVAGFDIPNLAKLTGMPLRQAVSDLLQKKMPGGPTIFDHIPGEGPGSLLWEANNNAENIRYIENQMGITKLVGPASHGPMAGVTIDQYWLAHSLAEERLRAIGYILLEMPDAPVH